MHVKKKGSVSQNVIELEQVWHETHWALHIQGHRESTKYLASFEYVNPMNGR